jgi:hypothetical protein
MASTDTINNEIIERTVNATAFQDRCYGRWLNAAISATTESVQATTNAATAAASNLLHFAAQPGTVAIGWSVVDTTTPSVIPNGTTVLGPLAANITLSANVTGAGVGASDIITFAPPFHAQRVAFAAVLFNNAVNRQTLAMLIMANATNRGNCLSSPTTSGGDILDSDIDFQVNSIFTGIATSRNW